MQLVIQPKDASGKLILDNVAYYFIDHNILNVWFVDGCKREYNMQYIWYIQTAYSSSSYTKF